MSELDHLYQGHQSLLSKFLFDNSELDSNLFKNHIKMLDQMAKAHTSVLPSNFILRSHRIFYQARILLVNTNLSVFHRYCF